MAQNDEVLEKYREGKANLDQLLQERRGLLERFRVLIGHARDLSTSDTIIKFDVVKAQDLCTALTDVETRIDSLIADVNAYAEKCGKTLSRCRPLILKRKSPTRNPGFSIIVNA